MVWPKETYAGVLFPNQSQFFGSGTGGNNHQSVFEFEGKYYFTYHAPTLNKRINGNTTQGYRSPHIQEMAFNADGSIQQVVGTYAGVEQVQDFDAYRVFEAETFGWSKGIATAKVTGGSAQFGAESPNLVVKDIDNGDWTGLSSVAFGDAGAASVTVKVKPLQAGGTIQVRSGSETGTVIGTIPVSGTVGEWTELTGELTGATGSHDVFFTYSGGSGDLFELDTWSFAEATAVPSLDVSADAASRCVAGKSVLTVKVTNADDVPVVASVTTAFGSKSSVTIAAGKSVSHAFSTRLAAVPGGVAAVSVTATVGGEALTGSVEAAHAAHSCG
jgi:arabinoxylan arabinofuranohydrolase